MNELCDYGCGQIALYHFNNGKQCCSKNHKQCPSLRKVGMPDPKLNIAHKKIECKYCKRMFSYSMMGRHENSCYLNPTNIKLCPVCEGIIKKGENKFCSSSCSAIFNNKTRKHTIKTRQKISKSLGGTGSITGTRKCNDCDNKTPTNRKYCNDCLRLRKIDYGKNIIDNASLAFSHYEESLSKILEVEYGPLRKEKINKVYPDFCNDKYIIDFTFDATKGTSDLINRFKEIKDDERIKIAFIPNLNVGVDRRNKLLNLNVKIEDSSKYKCLLNS